MNSVEKLFPFSPLFLAGQIFFEREGVYCCINSAGQIDVCQESKVQKSKETVQKICELNFGEILKEISPSKRENLLCNLISYRKSLVIEKGPSLFGLPFLKKANSSLPFLLKVETIYEKEKFSDYFQCAAFALHHFTSYPTSHPIQSIPTDHAGIREISSGYQLAICDGMGHHDPKQIGEVAAQIIKRALSIPLSQKVSKQAEEKKAYQQFLQTLNKEYHTKEGTTLLEVEACFSSKRWQIKVANYGDSALVVLNQEGKIVYLTKDRKREEKPDHSGPIGMLGIGGGLSDKLIQFADYEAISLEEGWLIACSDGLSEPFLNSQGEIERDRFEAAFRSGLFFPPPQPLPANPAAKLTPGIIADNLRKAISEASKSLKNGDDVTFIVLKLQN